MVKSDRRRSSRRLIVTAIISGIYEVLSFFGLPPYSYSPIAKTVAFLIFAIALLRIMAVQHKELETLRNPDIDFILEPTHTLQRDDPGWHAIHVRIAIKNTSEAIAKACRLVIESWTFSALGLNADTALTVKDEPDPRTDIPANDTKQFNLFVTVLLKGTDVVEKTLICAPNWPTLSSVSGGYQMILRLTGDNLDTRRYKLLLVVDSQRNVKVTRLDKLDSERGV